MPKTKTAFRCSTCARVEPRWLGRCTGCGAWNSYLEEVVGPARAAPATRPARPVRLAEVSSAAEGRITTGIAELDRVLGGGLVPGSLVLLGGDPGIGKSTLLLQALQGIAASSTT